jgi:hypothetical protein
MMRRDSLDDEYGNLDKKKSAWQIVEFLLTNILHGPVSLLLLRQNQEFGVGSMPLARSLLIDAIY